MTDSFDCAGLHLATVNISLYVQRPHSHEPHPTGPDKIQLRRQHAVCVLQLQMTEGATVTSLDKPLMESLKLEHLEMLVFY